MFTFKKMTILSAIAVSFIAANAMSNTDTNADLEDHLTQTGAIFSRDTSYPALGEAYRDPSGLIWGDVARDEHGRILHMNAEDAENYCASIGARLATMKEYIALGTYLGGKKWYGYNPVDYLPFTPDGRHEILGGLSLSWHWTSTQGRGRDFTYIFWGDTGEYSQGRRKSKGGVARCVMSKSAELQ